MKNHQGLPPKERGINKTHKIKAVIFVSKNLKKSVHSGATDLFFKVFRNKKDKLRCAFYYSLVPNLYSCLFFFFLIVSCNSIEREGTWETTLHFGERKIDATLILATENGEQVGHLNSFQMGDYKLKQLKVLKEQFSAQYERWEDTYVLKGNFKGDDLEGVIYKNDEKTDDYFIANKLSDEPFEIDRSSIEYIISDNDLEETELNIDHAGLIAEMNRASYTRGERIYNSNCINCHGNEEIEGSIPTSTKFWSQAFKAGADPYSMYQSITKGFGLMIPQVSMTQREKYEVITFIREAFIKNNNPDQYFKITPGYLAGLPKGTSKGPESSPYKPWSDQNYGNFFMNTYELVDEETGPARYHSPGPTPYPDENYLENNFAYKGIAIRLDEGEGGVSEGNTWMMFDHDLMRVAGGWTGEGFIDWDAILLNDRHETYPRTIGKLHFETPVGPGWVNPTNGTFEDPRFTARDGRQFGGLPRNWADYKGLYQCDNNLVISYTVGSVNILEQLGMEKEGAQTVFTRTLNISASTDILKLKVAPISHQVSISGTGASLSKEDGFHMMTVQKAKAAQVKLFIANPDITEMDKIVEASSPPESLSKYTKGGAPLYPEELTSVITKGNENKLFAVDQLTPPFENPWNCRMKLSGIDFMKDLNKAVACTTDGDVWLITGLTNGGVNLKWKRIGAGLFQPLGIKVVDEKIFVTCRDQIVLLRDFNGDDETDFYESFNHDHQVSDHFHEFAMGLQADDQGNLYYAKSGRHAREALIPQHGTLLKVSHDGAKTDIIATGFRAANGVCLNPDGSFFVTDQQGYWNPMNRINWIQVGDKARFYGNMWGYDPPKDSSRAGMEPPMVWVDMDFDRSPSELLWVESEKWGPLDGSLLSFSYGYGKIQLVYQEEVNGQKQGGVIDIPGMKFYTGVMRGRFHPEDGNLYLCGMSAWSTSQNMRTGDLYRIRYTGKPLTFPIQLNALESGIKLTFANELDRGSALDMSNYVVKTWDLIRSKRYGSDRHNVKTLEIDEVNLSSDGRVVHLLIDKIAPVDVMTIEYDIEDVSGNDLEGIIQNTIHNLGKELVQ